MTTIQSAWACVISAHLVLTANAASVSTGDLGANVVSAGGAYQWSPAVSSPSSGLPARLTVTYGLWNDPDVLLYAYVNGTEVGSFMVHDGYFFPGPSTNSFDIAGLLVDGVNTIRLDGLGSSPGDYVVGSIELDYNLPLPPMDPPPPQDPPPADDPPSIGGPLDGPFLRRGTSLLHYTTRTPFAVTDAGAGMNAAVNLDVKEQGNAAKQRFDVMVTGLSPNTTYVLIAMRGDEADASAIGTFISDRQGRAHVSSTKQANSHAKVKGSAVANLFPVTNIRAVGIQDEAAQTLGLASIDASPSFHYLVKRNLTPADPNGTAGGSISLEADGQGLRFRLLAGGLNPGATYFLTINAIVVGAMSADTGGGFQVTTWPSNAPAVLTVRTLAVTDSSGNSVLGTALPE